MLKISAFTALLVTVSLAAAAPCFGLISGTVTDTLGNPVSGAKITFTNEADSTLSYTETTDATGSYQISITTYINETFTAPLQFTLRQNYPNPFNPSTVIPFSLPAAGKVILTVYTIQGQKVATLLNGYLPAGGHSVRWNGLDNRGRSVGAGIYLYQLRAGGRSETKKMLLLDGGDFSISGGSPSVNMRQKGSGKIAGPAYRVTITGDDIDTYQERGLLLADGGSYNFSVIRRTVIAGITFVSIPGGTFQMGDVEGDGDTDENPVHSVTLTGFEMSAYEITNAQYAMYLNDALKTGDITATSTCVFGAKEVYNGQLYIYFVGTSMPDAQCYIKYSSGGFSVESGKENYPLIWVSWYGAKAFAQYYGLDLPTEAEWEYACRGGRQFKYGTDDGTLSLENANYWWDTGIEHPVAVGSYPMNPFGLFDMSGNVFEWCYDWYEVYPSESLNNPSGAKSGTFRMIRGGSWSHSDDCRAASRIVSYPAYCSSAGGFRVVRRFYTIDDESDSIAAPSILIPTTVSSTQIDLTWQDNSDNEQGFRIELKQGSKAWGEVGAVSENMTTYSVTRLFADKEYMFRVRAYSETSYSAYSDETMAQTLTDGGSVVTSNIHFVSIPGGTFRMGDEEGDLPIHCLPLHTVTVSDFEMSIYEITNSQYAEYLNSAFASGDIEVKDGDVYGKTGQWTGELYLDIGYGYGQNMCWISYNDGTFSVTSGYANWPVVAVTWYGSKAFALYYGLELPTEAEWEYTCRGGRQYMYGTDDGTISSTKANYFRDGGLIGHPVDVGSYPKNPFGLYDMSGNVSEWCYEWKGRYTSGSQTDPIGAQPARHPVARGGSWGYGEGFSRSAYRDILYPEPRSDRTGFRVIRRISP
jgi:formylglycine-generating enzyme required for sulfatase activity